MLASRGDGSAATANWVSAPSQIGVAQRVTAALRDTDFKQPAYLFSIAVLAGIYYGSARLGYELGFSGPVGAIVWLPVGVAIAALTLAGPRYWPGALLGDLLATNHFTLPLSSAIGQTIGNLLEVLIAAILIRRISRHGSPLGRFSDLVQVFGVFGFAVAVSATIGLTSLWIGGVVSLHSLPVAWRTWWLGDYAGALIVAPLALAWYRPLPDHYRMRRVLEALALVVIGVGLTQVAIASSTPILYLVFPALIWAATRFGQRGATVGILIASSIAVWNTAHHGGSFHYLSVTRSVLTTQLFIVVIAVSTLCLSALLAEREKLAANLRSSRARLLEASDTERRRLEQNLHDGAQQQLIGVAYRLREAAEHRPQDAEQTARLTAAETELRLAIDEVREIAHGIHPSVLTDLGLAHAVRAAAGRSAVPVTFVELPTGRVDERAETAAYYVFTEALANAQKHASATAIEAQLAVFDRTVFIRVFDDGIGGADEASGSGLTGLRDRVEALGGSFKVESGYGRGTAISASIPRT